MGGGDVQLSGSRFTQEQPNDYDIVICVGWNDVLVVKKTIKYIRENLRGDNIYLILNNYYFNIYSKQFLTDNKVILVDEDTLVPGVTYKSLRVYFQEHRPNFTTGWYYQQFLKMAFSLSEYAKDYYLIWDSDTLPLSKLEFGKNGKLLFTQKKEYHREYFDTIEKIFGLKKEVDYSFIAEHMLIKTSIMREIINKLSKEDSLLWPYYIIRHIPAEVNGGFSEFETYGTYVTHYYPDLYTTRTLNTWRNAGFVFGRNISDRDVKALSVDLDIISLESWNGRLFPQKLFSRIRELYVRFLRYKYLKTNNIKVNI